MYKMDWAKILHNHGSVTLGWNMAQQCHICTILAQYMTKEAA